MRSGLEATAAGRNILLTGSVGRRGPNNAREQDATRTVRRRAKKSLPVRAGLNLFSWRRIEETEQLSRAEVHASNFHVE